VFREEVADEYGLEEDGIVVLIHCGSRGLGHQTCNDYLRQIEKKHGDLLAELPDKELAAAPAGRASWQTSTTVRWARASTSHGVNRQLITHQARKTFGEVFDADPIEDLEMELLYDVAHNIAKKGDPRGRRRRRRTARGRRRGGRPCGSGAVRPPQGRDPRVPGRPRGRTEVYRDVGQPVIIPGSMGAGSYVLRGGDESMGVSFGSTAHGAGRLMSRTQAKQEFWGRGRKTTSKTASRST